jgi:sporulation protein YlmC with PRC-barrel domain
MLLSDENLRGRTVIAADGGAIGNVGAIFLDSDTWQVKSLYVRLRKDIADRLGAERSLFHAGTVEITTSLV